MNPTSRPCPLTVTESRTWTLLGDGCLVQGDLVLTGDVLVHGRIEGTLFTDGDVWIAPRGSVEGGIHGATVFVDGTCRGRLEALQSAHLRRGCTVQGEVASDVVRVERGARFLGATRERESGPSVQAYVPRGSA